MRIAAHVVFGFLLVAAIAKFVDHGSFTRSLETWTLLPTWTRPALAVVIPLVELFLAGAWFLRSNRRGLMSVTIGLLIVYTGVYGAHLLWAEPPDCECIGLLRRFEQSQGLAAVLIARNVTMITMLFGQLLSASTKREKATSLVRCSPEPALPVARRGFTILETLVVIALIAVLVALILPAFARVRAEAQEIGSLANLRTHASTLGAYAGDYADANPFLTDPSATATVIRGGGTSILVPFFFLYPTWNIGLADDYYGGDPLHRSLHVPWTPSFEPPSTPYTLYWYADCLISRPEYWNPLTRRGDRSQWRQTTLAEIMFPSQKGTVLEHGWSTTTSPPRLRGSSVRLALADGSAAEWPERELSSPYATGSDPGHMPAADFGLPVMHTIDGVRGRDTP